MVMKQQEEEKTRPTTKPLVTTKLHVAFSSPTLRGMVSYAIIWPLSCITKGYILEGKPIEKADWNEAARFGFFGAFFMAPVFNSWLKFSNRFFPKRTIQSAVTRSLLEQVSYSPLALASFFFGISLLEGRIVRECVEEVRQKFWQTYKVNAVFWPIVQTVNFYFITPKNRIVFASLSSYLYTIFLAHMKSKCNKGDNCDSGLKG